MTLRTVRLAQLGWSSEATYFRGSPRFGRTTTIHTVTGPVDFMGALGQTDALKNAQRQLCANDLVTGTLS